MTLPLLSITSAIARAFVDFTKIIKNTPRISVNMPDYERIRECILKVLAKGSLTNREICDRVHAIIPHALSSDSIACSHTSWNQKEWEHEVRRAIYQLKVKGKIVFDSKNHLYRLA